MDAPYCTVFTASATVRFLPDPYCVTISDANRILIKTSVRICSMLDFAPLYSGVIMGFSNTVANFTGVLAPLSTGKYSCLLN